VNRHTGGGVLPDDAMEGLAARLAGGFVTVDETLEREFEARLVETSTLAFRVAYGVLRQREDAEDVAQDAFVKAHRSFAQLRDRDHFRAWLVRMTWRLAIDRQRSDRRRIARDRSPEADFLGAPKRQGREGGSPAALEDLEARERATHLWTAIDALPEKLRIVIVLAGIEEQDIARVAQLLDVPPGTVKSRLFLARQRLKEQLQWTL
jgi:RNA polymerase sigma-70 factor (ECF subfamily)